MWPETVLTGKMQQRSGSTLFEVLEIRDLVLGFGLRWFLVAPGENETQWSNDLQGLSTRK